MTAILVIDDEPAVCNVIKLLLGRAAYAVVTCAAGQTALDILPSQEFAVALIDLGLEPVQGRHVIEAVRAAKPALPIVVMSGVLVDEADDHLPGLPAEFEGLSPPAQTFQAAKPDRSRDRHRKPATPSSGDPARRRDRVIFAAGRSQRGCSISGLGECLAEAFCAQHFRSISTDSRR